MSTASSYPRLLLVADNFTRPEVARRVILSVRAGVRWVQLRDHLASSDDFDAMSMKLVYELTKIDNKTLISVNSRIKVAQLHDLPFHTGSNGPTFFESKLMLGPDAKIGLSTHDGTELANAVRENAAYVTFSPIFPTTSHPGTEPVGLNVLRNVCHHATMPVMALGGITPSKVQGCLNVGAHGVAVVSSILSATDPIKVIQEFNAVIPGL